MDSVKNRNLQTKSFKFPRGVLTSLGVLLTAIILGMPFTHELHHCDGIIESEDCPVYLLQKSLNSDTSILLPNVLLVSWVFSYHATAWSINTEESLSKSPVGSRAPPFYL